MKAAREKRQSVTTKSTILVYIGWAGMLLAFVPDQVTGEGAVLVWATVALGALATAAGWSLRAALQAQSVKSSTVLGNTLVLGAVVSAAGAPFHAQPGWWLFMTFAISVSTLCQLLALHAEIRKYGE